MTTLTSNTTQAPIVPPNGPFSPKAADIARGASRCLLAHGYASVQEMPLANGRRADLLALHDNGEIWIVEIKSSLADFRADQKWPEYRDYCDRLLFAVSGTFPVDVLPEDTGLIIADRYGGELVRAASEHKLSAARRKSVVGRFARLAALRLHALADPDMALAIER